MRNPIPVALVYGESESSQALRKALGEIGADLVCDADVDSFNVDSLGASGAGVVLISLDETIEARLDEVYGALDEDRYRVMFDDPEISNSLDGWEHARWQRHLAAKLRDIADWDPPRPEGAAAVEVAPQPEGSDSAPAEAPDWMNEALSVLGESRTGADEPGSAADDDVELESAQAVDSPELTGPVDLTASADDGTMESSSEFGSMVEDTRTANFEDFAEDASASPEVPVEAVAEDKLPDAGETAATDLDDAELQAQLDALADAEDPLAALSALAGESSEDEQDGGVAELADSQDMDLVAEDLDELDFSIGESVPDQDPEDELADALEQQPSAGPDAPASSDLDEDGNWDALEAELSAAFDSDTLGAIDQAGSHDDRESGETPVGEPAAADDPAESARAEESVLADEDHHPATPEEVMDEPAGQAAPAAGESSSTPGSSLPDVSQWALVDDDLPAPNETSADDLADRSDQAETTAAMASGGEDVAEESVSGDDEDDGHFGLELVDPIDYLKPEAPKDVSTELFNMPSLMSMAEAVAPKVGDEDDAPADARARIERVVVLGASIGGPDAVREFLSHLPQRLPATIILVQHLGSEFVDLMVSQLAKSSALPVRIPGRAERAVHGEVLVVPSGSDIVLAQDGQVTLKVPEGQTSPDPSINRTLAMAAEVYGALATGIIFSGMASRVADGAAEIASRGGEVWVQDPESCVVSKMVDEVIAAGVVRFTGSPQALAHQLVAHLQETDNAPDQ